MSVPKEDDLDDIDLRGCGWDGEHCQEEELVRANKELESQVKRLGAIVEKRGNFAEVNYARGLRGKKPLSEKYWTRKDIEGMGG